jgi:V/A-type H+-transporting ATPase subunit D
MTDLDQLPATRTTLLTLRGELDNAGQGHAILERKREALLRELRDLLRQVNHAERDLRERFDLAYKVQREARVTMGRDAMGFAGLAPAAQTVYSVESRTVMGVALPLVALSVEPLPFPYSPGGIHPVFDELCVRWIEVGKALGPWSEMIGSIRMVADELQRTQRLVNALESILIPRYQAAIRRIQAILEEQERESFSRTKRVKQHGQWRV